MPAAAQASRAVIIAADGSSATITLPGRSRWSPSICTLPDSNRPAPPSLHTDQARGYRDGAIFHILTKGTEKMPGYADKLSTEDRWETIHYLRALQRAMNPSPGDLEQ